jgi:sec-independent protein translocase protein TatB
MLDVGWSEMAVILMVALIVIGPKDLPRVARTIGKWTAKARGMAREFQRALDDMAREAELQDIKAEMDKLARTDVRQQLEETIDPEGELRRGIEPPKLDSPPAKPAEAVSPPEPPAAAERAAPPSAPAEKS